MLRERNFIVSLVCGAHFLAPVVSAAAAAADGTLEEVIVTAQRVAEDLQKAAAAITSLSAQELTDAGVSQAVDLSKLVPGLSIGQGGPSVQVYLRGVGNYGTNAFADPAVAFNYDGVYLARFSALNGNFYDIERVEVLKGPQGTLYGRNATGGAINIVTASPSRDGNDFGFGAEVGNYSLRRLNAFANWAVGGRSAVRISGQTTDRKGYQTDGYDDDVSNSFRIGYKFDADDDTGLLVKAGMTHIGGRGATHVPITRNGFFNNANPRIGISIALPPVLTAIGPPPNPTWQVRGVSRADGFIDVDQNFVAAEFTTGVGGNTLTALASHMSTDNFTRAYGPGFKFWPDDTADQDSVELRLANETDRLKWVAGLYYFKEDQTSKFWVDQGYRFNQTGVRLNALDDKTSAVFAQLTIKGSEVLRWTIGLRGTRETKDISGEIFFRQAQGGPPLDTYNPVFDLPCPPSTTRVTISAVATAIPQAALNTAGESYPWGYCRDLIQGSQSFNDTSWKGGFEYDVRPQSLLYGSVSRGFKAGGFFASGNNADLVGNKFRPETLLAYALGSKNRFNNDRLQLNAELFHWIYKDHQENYLTPSYSAGGFNFTTQRADAEISGLDVELDALLTVNDRFSAKLQYLDAKYTSADFIYASPGPGNPPPVSACAPRQPDPTRLFIYRLNCNGQEMPRSPKFSGTLDYAHTFRLASGAGIVAGATAQYSAAYWAAVDYSPLQRGKAYTMWNADLTYRSPDNRYFVSLWGQNLSDEIVYSNAFLYPASNAGTTSVSSTQLRAPRTYGLRFNVDF